MRVYEFQTKANSCEDIGLISVWNFLRLSVSNQSKFSRRHLLSLSFKLSMFMTFKQKRNHMKTFVESQFEIVYVGDFQTKANSDEDICWVSVWNYLSWRVSNKS